MKYIFIENANMIGEKKNIIYNGILLNKTVSFTNDKDKCDYIFIDYRDANIANKYDPKYFEKMVIIDYTDFNNQIINLPCLKYFKRSVVNKKNLSFLNYNKEIIPISYCLKNETLEFQNIFENERNYDISIFFDPNNSNHGHNIYRNIITSNIQTQMHAYNNHIGYCGNNGKIGRNSIQKEYYDKMFHSKIVVTCNPDHSEGDYRTWEALSSGALVFVDKMITPVLHPLIHEKHVIFYDKNDLRDLNNKLHYYLKNNEIRETIAKEGNAFALKYHKSSDRIDEILTHL